MGPYSNMTGVIIKRGTLDTGTQGDCRATVEAEMGLRHLQAKEHPKIASNPPDARSEAWS